MVANHQEKWTKPEPRQIKLNVDASFHANFNASASGAILRDYQGHFIAASNKCLHNVGSAAMAEAIAMKEGLSLATRFGCNNVIAELDSIETIEACTGSQSLVERISCDLR